MKGASLLTHHAASSRHMHRLYSHASMPISDEDIDGQLLFQSLMGTHAFRRVRGPFLLHASTPTGIVPSTLGLIPNHCPTNTNTSFIKVAWPHACVSACAWTLPPPRR